jgi:hypothetical protein
MPAFFDRGTFVAALSNCKGARVVASWCTWDAVGDIIVAACQALWQKEGNYYR